jgi:hypothetical protein
MSLAVNGSRSLEPGGELADLVERVAGEPPAPELLGDEDPWAEALLEVAVAADWFSAVRPGLVFASD